MATDGGGVVVPGGGNPDGGMGGGSGSGGGSGGGGDSGAVENSESRSVREDELWRERAEVAEARVAELEGELAALTLAMESSREESASAERRHEMERLLRDANAVDVETAVLLTELAVLEMESPDVALAVEELRASKPFLFGSSGSGSKRRATGSAMSAALSVGPGGSAADLAEAARASGDRAALLRYLRSRRG